MAYIHCHNCNWQQDDFWSVGGYNPIRFFLTQDVPWLIRPRIITFDKWVAKKNGWSNHRRFSWWVLWWEFKRMCLKFRRQYWWTWGAYKKRKIKTVRSAMVNFALIDRAIRLSNEFYCI
jgi:hypothetical protein